MATWTKHTLYSGWFNQDTNLYIWITSQCFRMILKWPLAISLGDFFSSNTPMSFQSACNFCVTNGHLLKKSAIDNLSMILKQWAILTSRGKPFRKLYRWPLETVNEQMSQLSADQIPTSAAGNGFVVWPEWVAFALFSLFSDVRIYF